MNKELIQSLRCVLGGKLGHEAADALEEAERLVTQKETERMRLSIENKCLKEVKAETERKLAIAVEALNIVEHTEDCFATWIEPNKCNCCIGKALAQIGEEE